MGIWILLIINTFNIFYNNRVMAICQFVDIHQRYLTF